MRRAKWRAAPLLALAPGVASAKKVCPTTVPEGAFAPSASWASTAGERPGRILAPLLGETSPPISVEGLCDSSQFSSQGFAFGGLHGGEWTAWSKPVGDGGPTVSLHSSADCPRSLRGLSVAVSSEKGSPSLRLHFASGCNGSAAGLEIPFTNATDHRGGLPVVSDIPVVDFVCQVSALQCALAKQTLAAASEQPKPTEPPMAEGEVGVGRCGGAGVRASELGGAKTASECSQSCRSRRDQNAADAHKQTCKGFAWSEQKTSCILYDGFPVTQTDGSEEDGYRCWEPGAQPSEPGSEGPASTTTPELPPAQEVRLDLSSLLGGGRAVTARRLQVESDEKGCFEAFDWLTLDRLVYLPPADFVVLRELAEVNSDEYVFLNAPSASVTVERVCVRDCSGALGGECAAEEPSTVTKVMTTTTSLELEQPLNVTVPDGLLFGQLEVALRDAMGDEPFEKLAHPETLPWMVGFSCLSLILGFVVTSRLAGAALSHKDEPVYQTVQTIKLVYDGDGEGEEEVVMQTVPGSHGTVMQSVGPPLGTGTWRPTKATPLGSTASAGQSFFSARHAGGAGPMQSARSAGWGHR